MKLGANRRNVIILGALALVGVYVLWTNVFSSDGSSESESRPRATAAPAVTGAASIQKTATRRRINGAARPTEWIPEVFGPVDPLKSDPTLRLDLLAKVQRVEVAGAQRNLFQFGDAVAPVSTPMPTVGNIHMGKAPTLPPGQTAGIPTAPIVAGPPPITLKYYGYSSPRSNANHKRAFFLDGDDIIVASEGELIKKRYRLVKIGVNSVTMEDTQFKDSTQTLPLAEDLAS